MQEGKAITYRVGWLPLYGSDFLKYLDSILKRHFIPIRRELWDIESFEEFTEERTNLIKNFIKSRYPDIYHDNGV